MSSDKVENKLVNVEVIKLIKTCVHGNPSDFAKTITVKWNDKLLSGSGYLLHDGTPNPQRSSLYTLKPCFVGPLFYAFPVQNLRKLFCILNGLGVGEEGLTQCPINTRTATERRHLCIVSNKREGSKRRHWRCKCYHLRKIQWTTKQRNRIWFLANYLWNFN